MPDPIIENDTANVHDWDQIITYFNADGSISAKQITYDLGNYVEILYQEGAVYQIREEDLSGADVANYRERVTQYDANGDMVLRETLLDDGVQKTETFDNAFRLETNQIDASNAYAWDRIVTGYSMGELTFQQIFFDDDREIMRVYQDGKIQQEDQFDRTLAGDPNGQDWETIRTYYSEGAVVARETTQDDGVLRVDHYVNGALDRVEQIDQAGSARVWESDNTYFYPDGEKAGREIVYDNGVQEFQYFEQGTRTRIELLDQSAGGAAKTWETQNTYFDLTTGDKVARVTVFDSGVRKEELYENGQIERVNQNDMSAGGAAKSWESIEVVYDPQGNQIAKNTVFDTGVTREEAFENGQRMQTVETDAANSFNWASMATQYDASGDLLQKIKVNDNGLEVLTFFEQGKKKFVNLKDTADIFNWSERTTGYDTNGDREAMETIYDNGDGRIVIYNAGGNSTDFRIEVDGDASHSWQYKVVDFDEAGGDTLINYYDNASEVPVPYSDYLGLVSV